ncbi:MAG TPA: HAD-IA family hydrolase [Armatimonadota bacterium]|nr:HAD-IA family hydrolase [Armatimonadota bacterium]HOM83947.1 HAD-IA family hydrolase [Armatimonadota bacterium]HOQ29446.1 HAD-IA family hydrolase [Armatimonadota bacterium]HPO71531.1 HAD-IA family hydrolase [Armatimonadota bacterium]
MHRASLPGSSLPHAVFFDMDGLLVDSEPVHAAAYVDAFERAGLALHPDEYRAHVTLGGGSIRDLYAAKGGTPEGWPALFERKCELFAKHVREEMELLPGASELLQALADRGTPCLLATGSGRVNATVILERFGLRPYFAAILSGEDVSRAKPDPEIFLKAAALIGASPAHCVSLEDSPKGVRAATGAGVPCIAVPTSWTRTGDFTGAALIVHSLQQVTPLLLEEIVHNHLARS